MGILRASQQAVDETQNIRPQFPFHTDEKQEKIPPWTVVKFEISI